MVCTVEVKDICGWEWVFIKEKGLTALNLTEFSCPIWAFIAKKRHYFGSYFGFEEGSLEQEMR